MHEHGVADRLLETLLHRPDRPGELRPVAVTVLVPELGGLTQEALQGALDHVCAHEALPRIVVEVRTTELLGSCAACGRTLAVSEELRCPACEAAGVRLCGGETIVVESCRYA